jgi:hypothetical protein
MKYEIEVTRKIVPVTRATALAYWNAWELLLKAGGVIPETDRIDAAKVLAMYPAEKAEKGMVTNG